MSNVMMSEFALKRHRPEEPVSHFDGDPTEIVEFCDVAIKLYKYHTLRPGIISISIEGEEASRFRVGKVRLTPEFLSRYPEVLDGLRVEFAPRVGGHPEEKSYIRVWSVARKPEANRVELILYSAEILKEEEPDPIVSPPGVDWQIISINASISGWGQEGVNDLGLEAMVRNSTPGEPGGTPPDEPYPGQLWWLAARNHLECVNISESIPDE